MQKGTLCNGDVVMAKRRNVDIDGCRVYQSATHLERSLPLSQTTLIVDLEKQEQEQCSYFNKTIDQKH